MDLNAAIEKAKADSKKRNFVQSMDIFINFKNIDFNKPENKLNLEVQLPKGRGRATKICVICNDELAAKAKGVADFIIPGNQLEEVGKDKKKVKAIANDYDAFVAEVSLMAGVGKWFGQALGPRGKMPKPIPPTADPKATIERLRGTVALRNKGKNLPVIHAPIGMENMSNEDLAANALTIIQAIKAKLPNPQNMSRIYIKTTMGPTVEVTEGM